MSSAEKFCLRWNDFESNISLAFRELREDKDFFDVTLACDDDQIQAHKVILSACSPFFRTILKRNRHEHPLLYLKGVKYIDLMAVLNFMYHGEVNVAQEELNSFLAIAEDLKVKGLTQSKSEEAPRQQLEDKTPKPRPRDPPEEREEPSQQPKRSRQVAFPEQVQRVNRNTTQQPYQGVDEDIQEVAPVKTEPISVHPEPQHIQIEEALHHNQVVDPNLDNTMGMYEENYADYDNYEEGNETGYDDVMMTADNADGNKAYTTFCDRTLPYLQSGPKQDLSCRLCDKTGYHKMQMMKHVETNHLKTNDPSYGYFCDLCSQFCMSYNLLIKHKRVLHKK